MKIVHQEQAIHIVGIELRTTNQEAFETIPRHWQRFGEEGVLARIPGKLSDEVYAVYTNFENAGRNNEGLYSLIIGARVPPGSPLPKGLAPAVAPAGPRAVFPVEKGRVDLVGAAWQAIWARHDLKKTYLADYERYGADGTIDIFIGIAREPLPA
ncbi:GyrI-like domain-containing protein [Variovorax terrae]|uniref:GyrI-like domain-containing protein n=1 Tax=Variovorax terrae TaxID=2923278 RepID=A0A9X1VUG4_9BURK|nr:GyrI-like domain-containing protein [Variovorax terrae]MCJ0763527.1 GyrI-like domain-containing protein [Variovorax terrae]